MAYLRFYLTPVLILHAAYALYFGGNWMWFGFGVAFLLVVVGDAVLGDDTSHPDYKHPLFLNLPLYTAFPILTALLLALARSGNRDYTGMDYLGGVLSTGLLVAGYGTNVAHELTHQIDKKWKVIIGRWILSMSCNADFSVEHVYGHHTTVGTPHDPATAKRGENIYAFFLRSTWNGHRSAWKIEKARLFKEKRGLLSVHNQLLTGYGMTAIWILVFYALAGGFGVVLFLAQGIFAKFILEVVNYMEHYGLSRRPGEPVKPQHSWNSNKRMSLMVLYSLVRHSAHHERARVPFWKLDAYPRAPEMPYGYLTTILLSLVPPLWFSIMESRLNDWDLQYRNNP